MAGGVNGTAGGMPSSGADAVRSGSGASGAASVCAASEADWVASGVADVAGDSDAVALTDADGDCVADCSSAAVSSPAPQADKNSTAARPVAITAGRVPVRLLRGARVILLMATVCYFSGWIAARITWAR